MFVFLVFVFVFVFFFANFDGFKRYLGHFWVLIYGLGVNKSISAVKITIHSFVCL